MDQRPQHKTRYAEPDRREMGNSLEHICTGEDFWNRTSLTQILRSTVNEQAS